MIDFAEVGPDTWISVFDAVAIQQRADSLVTEIHFAHGHVVEVPAPIAAVMGKIADWCLAEEARRPPASIPGYSA